VITGYTAANLVNGIIGGWAIAESGNFATYNATPINGAFGVIDLSYTSASNAYSSNALTVGVATDNIHVSASVGAVTNRTINSLMINTAAAVSTMNTQGDTLTIGTGGLLTNFAGVVVAGGRMSAGATLNTAASIYNYANATTTINSVIADNGAAG